MIISLKEKYVRPCVMYRCALNCRYSLTLDNLYDRVNCKRLFTIRRTRTWTVAIASSHSGTRPIDWVIVYVVDQNYLTQCKVRSNYRIFIVMKFNFKWYYDRYILIIIIWILIPIAYNYRGSITHKLRHK